jgi:hypothetical protein
MLAFAVLGVLGTLTLIVGLVAGVKKDPDAQLLSSVLIYAGWLLLAVAAVIVVQAAAGDVRGFLADFFPNAERREQTAAAAGALGLRSLTREQATIDLTFPFGDDLPLVATVFAGNWRGLEVQIFDCRRARQGFTMRRDSEHWTCAILPIATDAEIEISRRSMDSRFDYAFNVETASEEDARLIDERVRSRLLEDTPKDRVAIEIEGGRMLYCCARLPLEERGALLDIAKRLRDAFPAAGWVSRHSV